MVHFLAQLIAHFSNKLSSGQYGFGKAFKCMRSSLAHMILALGCLSNQAWADHADALMISTPDQANLQGAAYFWHEQPGKLGIQEVSALGERAPFLPLREETMFNFKPANRLWIRLDLDHKANTNEHFQLWIPLPLIDRVTLHQKNASGKWENATAGDLVAVALWPEPGRYPRFPLDIPPGKSTVYLQIQGSTPLSIPLHLGSEVPEQEADRQGFLGMGVVVGVLLTLVLMCMVTAYTYRDRLYLQYGLYMLVMILAVAAYTGLAGYLLWDRSPRWADAAQGVLAILSAGGALYFVEAMLAGRQFAQRMSMFFLTLSACSLPLAVLYYFVPRSAGVIILGVYILTVSSTGLALAVRTWRLGDRVGQWVFCAYLPLALAVLLAIARAYGWLVVSWVVQYGVVMALLIEAPMMMAALHVRSRQRHEISTREQAMGTQDALTGLLKEIIFDDRVRQTMARSRKHKEDAAVVLISLVNYDVIAAAHGLPVAEQSVLRAVIKLRKVLRDVDTVARVGTANFGLILEGVAHRSRITEIGARLIAQGLMPLPGLVPEVTLQFHLAAVLMREVPDVERDIKAELVTVLQTMSQRTRRPIRFWEPTSLGGTALTAVPTASSPVDVLAAKVKDAASQEVMLATKSNVESPSSSGGWDSTNQEDGSVYGGDTHQMPRNQS
jgi:two-component system, sensor histidine kinase LadS